MQLHGALGKQLCSRSESSAGLILSVPRTGYPKADLDRLQLLRDSVPIRSFSKPVSDLEQVPTAFGLLCNATTSTGRPASVKPQDALVGGLLARNLWASHVGNNLLPSLKFKSPHSAPDVYLFARLLRVA